MQETLENLSHLKVGQVGIVEYIIAKSAMKERFLDLGLVKGTKVLCLFEGYCKDIKVYNIRGACIAIRDIDAASIIVRKEQSHENKAK